MTFENDEKCREHLLENLREKHKDPEFRNIEGFPIGEDEGMPALSDPPYYTVCPKSFIENFIKHYGKSHDPNAPGSRNMFMLVSSNVVDVNITEIDESIRNSDRRFMNNPAVAFKGNDIAARFDHAVE
jgi:hypothetical protein